MSKRQQPYKTDAIVVSPSGNLYGSEQVLFDYLLNTRFTYEVFAPTGSVFLQKLGETRHEVSGFSSVPQLYLHIFRKLLGGRHKTVYVNEAGHSKYIHILARCFPGVRFLLHVRIMEDTDPEKWKRLRPQNTTLVTISSYLQQALAPTSIIVRDLFSFPDEVPHHLPPQAAVKQVAVVGRVSYSKGFRMLVDLARLLAANPGSEQLMLNIYGDVSGDVAQDTGLAFLRAQPFVCFHGFVDNKEIYRHNELVLHLSKTEPLGRIFFEAIAAGRPLVGFNAGGIGEIARLTGLKDFVVDESPREIEEILARIHAVTAMQGMTEILNKALVLMKQQFSVDQYVGKMDSLMMKTPD